MSETAAAPSAVYTAAEQSAAEQHTAVEQPPAAADNSPWQLAAAAHSSTEQLELSSEQIPAPIFETMGISLLPMELQLSLPPEQL